MHSAVVDYRRLGFPGGNRRCSRANAFPVKAALFPIIVLEAV